MIQEKILMKQAEVKYAPEMRIIVRGEEWMVKKSRRTVWKTRPYM